jgi:hypothetical protein
MDDRNYARATNEAKARVLSLNVPQVGFLLLVLLLAAIILPIAFALLKLVLKLAIVALVVLLLYRVLVVDRRRIS